MGCETCFVNQEYEEIKDYVIDWRNHALLIRKLIVEKKDSDKVDNILERVPVFINADSKRPLGHAMLYKDNGDIAVSFKIPNRKVLRGLYPSIGGIIQNKGENGEIQSLTITSVNLCTAKNVDPSIKSLGEQLGLKNE